VSAVAAGSRLLSATDSLQHADDAPAMLLVYDRQGFISQPVSGNRRAPVPVYRTGLTGYRWKPVEFKSKFK